jgi:glycine C-acetyltransferase
MYSNYQNLFQERINLIQEQGLQKLERVLSTKQGRMIEANGHQVINFCANNYLGLSADERIIEKAKESLDTWGYGMSSVRFIVGTQSIHTRLEQALSDFLFMEDTILYSSCYDANGGLFETLLGEEDAIISDALNHASIIDGIRLCKAKRFRYENNDMVDLEARLIEASHQKAKIKLIATDGVFSMDGTIANLKEICRLAQQYDALVMVDDSHATGFIGKTGRGTHEYSDVIGQVDILTGTFGKALGGASGGFTSGRKEIIQLLRQRSRPYLFSNSLAPMIAATSLHIIQTLASTTTYRDRLEKNTRYFRERMKEAGFDIKEGVHPIVPVMFYDALKATQVANALLDKGIYVIGFSYPVVPMGMARIRVQISALHTFDDIDLAVAGFMELKNL